MTDLRVDFWEPTAGAGHSNGRLLREAWGLPQKKPAVGALPRTSGEGVAAGRAGDLVSVQVHHRVGGRPLGRREAGEQKLPDERLSLRRVGARDREPESGASRRGGAARRAEDLRLDALGGELLAGDLEIGQLALVDGNELGGVRR